MCTTLTTTGIESSHNAARTYTHTILPRPMVSFFVRHGVEKNTKHINTSVYLILSLVCKLILWYEQNKRVARHFILFSNTRLSKKETNMAVAEYDDLQKWCVMTSHENLLLGEVSIESNSA